MVEAIAASYRRLRWRALYVETCAQQDQISAAISEHPDAAVFRHTIMGFETTGKNKMSENIGLPALDILVANGTIQWPDREAEAGADRAVWARFAAEVATMPRHLPPGMTPDGAMSWWFCDRGLTTIGGASFGDYRAETTDRSNVEREFGEWSSADSFLDQY
jgi:hypothetical protein